MYIYCMNKNYRVISLYRFIYCFENTTNEAMEFATKRFRNPDNFVIQPTSGIDYL